MNRMSNRQNLFPSSHNPCSDKIGNIYTACIPYERWHILSVQEPPNICTRNERRKQGTTPGRGQQLPCEVDYHPVPRQWRTWKNTTWKYKKVKINASLTCDLDYYIYLFRHLQVTSGTSAAGNAHQIRSTWFHLPSFWLADSLCNVFSAPLGISAPIG